VIRQETIEHCGGIVMPVNMDPSKKRRRTIPPQNPASDSAHLSSGSTPQPQAFGVETETDREKDLAEAESKNLWAATEVIDMDTV
jgi:hypothetical protein